ncbi:MAG: sugar transferase [Pirellulales bacterium]|nr:sugar transferase [Pirellulales bacterium]
MRFQQRLKRLLDVTAAMLALLLLAPLLAAVALAVYLAMGRPVLFRQPRAGLRGKVFTLYKFRTMSDARDNQGRLLPDDCRVTGVGRFLRSTSLDELPELINVLRGEMSLVGPRPLLPQYLGRYTPEQARRHEVRPGLTGLAQVKGRLLLGWEERFLLDVWYVDHATLAMDLKILLVTVWKVLRREGTTAISEEVLVEFQGTARREPLPLAENRLLERSSL